MPDYDAAFYTQYHWIFWKATTMGYGHFAALSAALLWTVSSLLWRKIHLTAWGLNFSKNVIGGTVYFIHLLLIAVTTGTAILTASATSVGLLAGSGVIGIVVGDTFYFRSLQILGPRRALLFGTTSPMFAVLLGWLIIGEVLLVQVVWGIAMTIVGIVVVILDRAGNSEAPNLFPGQTYVGTACGLGGALCQATGAVLAKRGMDLGCEELEASFYRVAVSALVMAVVLLGRRQLAINVKKIFQPQILKILVPATLIGTWLGIWFSQIAFKRCDVAVAQTLLSTCPLFALPIIYFVDRQRVSRWAILGTLIAVGGIFITIKYSHR